MFNIINKEPNSSVVVNRGQRKEPIWFKVFYEFYSILIRLFTGKKIRFGNFSFLNSKDIKKIFNNTNYYSINCWCISNSQKNKKSKS
mgnify:CR=1 FL=1